MNRKAWTTSEVGMLRELRAQKITLAKIALRLNRSRGSISGALVRIGMTNPAPPWRRPPGLLCKLLPKMLNRYGATEVADRLGISRTAIYTTLARMSRKRGKPMQLRFYHARR